MPHKPETSVAAIITDKDSSGIWVLLTLRGFGPFEDQWCLPGGHIDEGELWIEAIRREVEEETNLDFRARFFGSFEEVIPEYNIDTVVKVYEGCGIGEPQAKTSEVKEIKRFPLEEARTLPLAFCHNDILDAYANRTIPTERREELLKEYDVLRDEVPRRLNLRQQSLNLAITTAGILIATVTKDLVHPVVLMIYPFLVLFFAIVWTHNDFRVGQLARHIKENIEQQLPGIVWEHYLREQYAKLPHPILRHLAEWTAIGVFVGTDIMIIVLAIPLTIGYYQAHHTIFDWIILVCMYPLLGLFDLLAIGATVWLVRLRRKEYRRSDQYLKRP